jgi:hypothetical protein
MKQFLIEESDLAKLETLASRLYTEGRMSGDEMRDAAHALTAVARRARAVELPEDAR